MLNRLLLFVMAACLGTLFLKMELPIPVSYTHLTLPTKA